MHNLFKYIFLNILPIVFVSKAMASTPVNINTSVTGNYTVSDPNGDYLVIGSGGRVNGTITNGDPANPGHVDITNYNGNYNTGNFGTLFGTASSRLGYVLAAGSNTTLTISNAFYADSIFLENSTLNINTNALSTSNISIHNGVLDKKSGSTVNINTNYGGNTSFGFYQDNLVKNMSIENLNITNNSTLTLLNYAYVDNINVNSGSTLTVANSAAKIMGTVFGAGTVNINVNYNYNTTRFGASASNTLANLNINGVNLTLSDVDGYVNNAYIDNLYLNGTSSSLSINSNAFLYGTVYGTGTVNINTSYNNGTNTIFGTSGNSLANLVLNNSGTILDLNNIAYINNTNVTSGTTLNLNSGSSLTGNIYGAGAVNINTNYSNNSTYFGTSTANTLNTIHITNGNSLTLANTAYINNLILDTNSSTLNIVSGGGVVGTIKGNGSSAGVVNLNRNYSTSTLFPSNYFDTTFGILGSAINTMNITNSTLYLGNLAYIDNIYLDNNSAIRFMDGSALVGTVMGGGAAFFYTNYSTTNVDGLNAGNNTNLGTLSNRLATAYLTSGITLELGNSAYVDSLILTNDTALTLKEDAKISGTVYGSGTNEILNVNTIFDTGALGIGQEAYLGTAADTIATTNINANGGLTLNTDAYLDTINITAPSSALAPSLSLKGLNSSTNEVILFNMHGINYDSGNNLAVLITLKNDPNNPNNQYMEQLYNLSLMFNNNIATDLNVLDNNLYVNILSKSAAEGSKYLIDTDVSATYFDEVALVFETIFKKLSLETELNSSGDTDLYLVVKQDRTPTTADVSEGTITSSNVIDSWTFLDRTFNENVLIANLQNIDDKQEFFHALRNLSPDTSGLNIKIPTQSIISAENNIDKRLAYFRMLKFNSITNNYNIKNISRGDKKYYDDYFLKPYPENNFWMEIFGAMIKQDEVDKIFGYNANFYGGTVGYDVRVNTNFIFGISYTFNMVDAENTDYVKSDRDTIDAMTHNANLYFMIYNQWNYLTLNVGAGFNKYEQERKINFYNFHKNAKADYNGYSYNAGIEYGFNIMLYDMNRDTRKGSNSDDGRDGNGRDGKNGKKGSGKKDNLNEIGYNRRNTRNDDDYASYSYNEYSRDQNRGKSNKVTSKFTPVNKEMGTYNIGPIQNFIMLTPKLSLTYNNIMIDDYIEKGADAANLEIKTKDYQSLDINGGLALTFSRGISSNTSFQTILTGMVSYGIINDKVELDARYIDDDQFFKVYGFQPNDWTYSTGINFNLSFYDRIDLGLGFDYMFGDDVRGGMVSLLFLWAF